MRVQRLPIGVLNRAISQRKIVLSSDATGTTKRARAQTILHPTPQIRLHASKLLGQMTATP